MRSIYDAIKLQQDIFNGYGSQESSDLLLYCRIHPRMPVSKICGNDTLFARFSHVVINYQLELYNRFLSRDAPNRLPLISPHNMLTPFYFNQTGYDTFIQSVRTFRRTYVYMTFEELKAYEEDDLWNPLAVIQPDGSAKGLPLSQ
ncbi:MAG: hypothetical protein ACREHG_02750 [Candidatus Saccharimonadales bacterium]